MLGDDNSDGYSILQGPQLFEFFTALQRGGRKTDKFLQDIPSITVDSEMEEGRDHDRQVACVAMEWDRTTGKI